MYGDAWWLVLPNAATVPQPHLPMQQPQLQQLQSRQQQSQVQQPAVQSATASAASSIPGSPAAATAGSLQPMPAPQQQPQVITPVWYSSLTANCSAGINHVQIAGGGDLPGQYSPLNPNLNPKPYKMPQVQFSGADVSEGGRGI